MSPRLVRTVPTLTEDDWMQFQKMGDLNRDGKIDDADVKILIDAFNSRPGAPNWNPLADLDEDGWVGPSDVVILGDNYGKDIWTWKGLAKPAPTELLVVGLLAFLTLLFIR